MLQGRLFRQVAGRKDLSKAKQKGGNRLPGRAGCPQAEWQYDMSLRTLGPAQPFCARPIAECSAAPVNDYGFDCWVTCAMAERRPQWTRALPDDRASPDRCECRWNSCIASAHALHQASTGEAGVCLPVAKMVVRFRSFGVSFAGRVSFSRPSNYSKTGSACFRPPLSLAA